MKYYRLELTWNNFDEFFSGPLAYTSVRMIDNVERHNIPIELSSQERLCGFWVLEDPEDVIKFWNFEPPECEKSTNAYLTLNGLVPEYKAGRFCTRIDSAVFNNETLYEDLPLIHMYPSSKFHPKSFKLDDLQKKWDGRGSVVVTHVSIPDKFVEVYYKEKWYAKTTIFGEEFRRDIERLKNIDRAIPILGFANAPCGHFKK